MPLSTPLFYFSIGPFTKEYFTAQLRSDIKSLGIEGNFLGHSFRKGAATSAERNGLTKEKFQLLGHWKLDAYKRYIQPSWVRAFDMSSRFQSSSLVGTAPL